MSAFDDFQSKVKQHGAPATAGLVGALIATFLLTWMVPPVSRSLLFVPSHVTQMPWIALTYPFAGHMDFIGLVFSCLWLWGIGGAVERDLGSNRYLIFWFSVTFLGALAILAGSLLMGPLADPALFGTLIPLGAVTVVWGTRNQGSMITLMFVLPIAGKWLAWLSAGVVLFGMGAGNPMMGVLACLPLAAAWAFASNRIPNLAYGKASVNKKTWKPSEKNDHFFDEVRKREKDREERERLRRLFEGSIKDDPEDGRGSGSGR